MSEQADYDQFKWSVAKGFFRINTHQTSSGDYETGEFISPGGIVSVYRQHDLTRLDYAANGQCYSRSWRFRFGDRTIRKLARQLVADVQDSHP